MPRINGFAHIDLTVTDVERSVEWWVQVMRFVPGGRFQGDTYHGCSMMHPSGLGVTVVSHDVTGGDEFDERRVGLDHLAFDVSDRAELNAWVAHLDALGVENTGVIEAHYGDTVVFRDPDNTQLELFVFNQDANLAELFATDPRRTT